MGRPRITATEALVVATNWSDRSGPTRTRMPTLAARRDGHVSADEEGQPAEHLLLGESSFGADQCPDPLSKVLVVGHRTSVRTLPSGSHRVA